MTAPVYDSLKRPLRDLRISVTDRCNFRCTYCMPKEIFTRDFEFLGRDLLLTFEALDKARSVSGAAQLLGLSQPGGSAALARLRKALGDELFVYAGGVMQPTPAARRLAPGLRAALAQLREPLLRFAGPSAVPGQPWQRWDG